MALQKVLAEVVGGVAPDAVGVVGAVLGVVVLEHEGRALDPVGVRLAAGQAAVGSLYHFSGYLLADPRDEDDEDGGF